MHHFKALTWSIWFMGLRAEGKKYYWKLFVSYLFTSPPKFARFIVFTVYGYHFRTITRAQTGSQVGLQPDTL
jgi:hypothetical protein